MKLSSLGYCLFIIPLLGLAYQTSSYYCPITHNYVNLGDTIDQVTKACGNPTDTKTWTSVNYDSIPVEQWIYQARMPLLHKQYPTTGVNIVSYPITLAINFKDNQISQMMAEGNIVQAGYYCSLDTPIKIGDSKNAVKSLCGTPNAIKNTTQPTEKHTATQLIYIYKLDQYSNPVSLYFENFKLVKIEQ